ncbi:SdpI family protein [Caproiciproducens faecalis]|uniref:SdpI family protein n=1 Tax=Caproiciproducens faecalis TaxID=2820301 RepID=A0ABS7DPH3_9FIRM|nr:SdpI family protein [Caproiciproducens faecalis]MBW7573214.1 SdpI family protein [Caproiciproducens faecalis]
MKYLLGILPAYLLIVGIRYLISPPSKSSKMAYRTPLSMQNEKIWTYAQLLYGKRLLLGAAMMVPIVMIGFSIACNLIQFLLLMVFEIIISFVMAVSVQKTLAQTLQ